MFAMSGLALIAAVMLQCHDRSKSARNGHSGRPLVAPKNTPAEIAEKLNKDKLRLCGRSIAPGTWPRDVALFAAGHDRMSRYQGEKCLTPQGLCAGETTLPTRSDQAVAL